MDKNGELIKGFTDAYTVRGDTSSFGGSETSSPMESGAPVALEGKSVDRDATNSLGQIGQASQSDPMFDKFKHEMSDEGGGMSDIDSNKGSGSESPESVASSALGLALPDKFEKFADEQKL